MRHMKKTPRSILACIVLTPLLLSGARAYDQLGYQPKGGAALNEHIKLESELRLEKMSVEVDGQDMSDRAKVDMAMKTATQITVTDHYEALAGGRPAKLKRSYDELSLKTHISGSNAMTGDQERDIPASSELEGTTVVFTWDDGDSKYDVAFEGDKGGDPKLLENLEENLDLRGFLPGKEVAKGDTWKIPAEAVKAALAPGGDLKLRPDESDDSGGMMGVDQVSPADLLGGLEGEFQGTYGGTRQEGGAHVGVVQVKINAKSTQDMSAKAEAMKAQMADKLPENFKIDISAFDGEYAYEAEGELLWNLDTGLPLSLHLSGELRLDIDISMTMAMGEKDTAMDQSLTFAGTQTITYTTGE